MNYYEVLHKGRPIALQPADTVREAICVVAGCHDDELRRIRQGVYRVPDGRTLQVNGDSWPGNHPGLAPIG